MVERWKNKMKINYSPQNIILFLYLFSSTPLVGQENPSELSIIKNQVSKDSWIGIDKIQHIMYSKFISLGVQYILVNKLDFSDNNALPISITSSFFAGLSKEVIDGKSKKNIFSNKDMVANSMGLLIAIFVINNWLFIKFN